MCAHHETCNDVYKHGGEGGRRRVSSNKPPATTTCVVPLECSGPIAGSQHMLCVTALDMYC
jgi:hypothetical protein